ncbi:MAG: pyridoxal-phosphate dependent enzyme [Actinomycetia bacterium]|nr:pyridoxal-phosphate dependent enzyme [Actinomycetes bacterium]
MSRSGVDPVGAALVARTHRRVGPRVRRTPVIELPWSGGGRLVLKLESLQHAGSFKARGAMAQVLDVPGGLPIVAASGGNFGAAAAWAAAALGRQATVFVPEVTGVAKRERILEFGGDLRVGGAVYADAQRAADEFAASTGGALIHPYEPAAMIAGGGSCGLEFEEQAGPLDTVVVAVGGGGLMAGVSAWFGPRSHLVAVETEGTQALHAALEAGLPVDVEVSGIAADALGATRIGSRPLAGLRRWVNRSVVLSDLDVRAAQRWLWTELRVVAEPSGATALAAVLSGRVVIGPASRVGVIVCGANTDRLPTDD